MFVVIFLLLFTYKKGVAPIFSCAKLQHSAEMVKSGVRFFAFLT